MSEAFDPTRAAESIAALARKRGIAADMYAGATDALAVLATLSRRPVIKAVIADMPVAEAAKSMAEEEASKAEPEQSGVEKMQGAEACKTDDEPKELGKADDKTDEAEHVDETDPGQPEKTDPGHVEASKSTQEIEVTFDATALVQQIPSRFSAIEAMIADLKTELAKSTAREDVLRAELAKSHRDQVALTQLVEQANANARAVEAMAGMLQDLFPVHAAVLEVATKAHVEVSALRSELEDQPGRDRQPRSLNVNREAAGKLLSTAGKEITREQLAKALTNQVITSAQWREWCQTGRFSEFDHAHASALAEVQKFLSTTTA